MRITAELLHEKWTAIHYYDGGYIQVAPKHPLEWHIGFDGIDKKTVLLLTAFEPESLPASRSILAEKRLRTDGKWVLSLSLLRIEQESVFETLCADIITYSGEGLTDQIAFQRTIQRFKQWNRLLQHQHKALMDEKRRKGLLGELCYLCNEIAIGRPPLQAVQGWVGPDGADQDFTFTEGWYEIKSVGVAATSISISSLEQLHNPDVGELIVMRIDTCAPERAGAVSLGQKVDVALALVKEHPDAQTLLESKLSRYGYISLPEYYEQHYFYSGNTRYKVNADFPRLTSHTVASQIIEAKYAISLASIEHWRMEE